MEISTAIITIVISGIMYGAIVYLTFKKLLREKRK